MKAKLAPETRIEWKNILYCTDLSDAAMNALPYAAGFSEHFGSNLHGLFVRPTDEDRWEVAPPREFTEAVARKEMANQLSKFPGIPSEILVDQGDVWKCVESRISEKKIDLVIVGTRGLTGLGKLLLGSAAEAIFRRAPCAVLTVGPRAPVLPSRGRELSEILYATDFSPESSAAVAHAISLAQEYQARLTLLHVVDSPKTGDLVTSEQLQGATERRLRAIVPPESELWCEPHCIVGQGNAADEIVAIAEQRNADLIVLGVHRPDAAKHVPIGTSYEVASHATCPVLTIRG